MSALHRHYLLLLLLLLWLFCLTGLALFILLHVALYSEMRTSGNNWNRFFYTLDAVTDAKAPKRLKALNWPGESPMGPHSLLDLSIDSSTSSLQRNSQFHRKYPSVWDHWSIYCCCCCVVSYSKYSEMLVMTDEHLCYTEEQPRLLEPNSVSADTAAAGCWPAGSGARCTSAWHWWVSCS